MFIDTWAELGRVMLKSIMAYVALVALLRFSGKRTLAKMNAFDLVVTVALGSTLATTVLNRDVTLIEGVLAFTMLIGLQFVVAWLSVRSNTVRGLVKSEPTLLLYHGQMLDDALRSQRVTPEEVRSAIRAHGIDQVDQVGAVVLETDGSFSVLPQVSSTATALSESFHSYPPRS